jgi:hypothetical protein
MIHVLVDDGHGAFPRMSKPLVEEFVLCRLGEAPDHWLCVLKAIVIVPVWV